MLWIYICTQFWQNKLYLMFVISVIECVCLSVCLYVDERVHVHVFSVFLRNNWTMVNYDNNSVKAIDLSH